MGSLRDFLNNIKVTQVIDPVVLTASADGDGTATAGYSYNAFLALVGESGDTLSGSVMVELEVEESDDDSTYTDVADADLRGSVTGTNTGTFAVIDAAAEDDAAFECQYTGGSAYIRPVANLTGTHTNGIPLGIALLQFGPEEGPVS